MRHHGHGIGDATKIGVPTYFKGQKLTATLLRSYKKYVSIGKATINKINPTQYVRWGLTFVKAKVRWLSKKLIFFGKLAVKKLNNEPFFYYISFNTFGKVSLPLYKKSVHFVPKRNWDSYMVFTMFFLLGSTLSIWWKLWFINFKKA